MVMNWKHRLAIDLSKKADMKTSDRKVYEARVREFGKRRAGDLVGYDYPVISHKRVTRKGVTNVRSHRRKRR